MSSRHSCCLGRISRISVLFGLALGANACGASEDLNAVGSVESALEDSHLVVGARGPLAGYTYGSNHSKVWLRVCAAYWEGAWQAGWSLNVSGVPVCNFGYGGKAEQASGSSFIKFLDIQSDAQARWNQVIVRSGLGSVTPSVFNGSVVSGTENGYNRFICRVTIGGEVYPGKYMSENNHCNIVLGTPDKELSVDAATQPVEFLTLLPDAIPLVSDVQGQAAVVASKGDRRDAFYIKNDRLQHIYTEDAFATQFQPEELSDEAIAFGVGVSAVESSADPDTKVLDIVTTATDRKVVWARWDDSLGTWATGRIPGLDVAYNSTPTIAAWDRDHVFAFAINASDNHLYMSARTTDPASPWSNWTLTSPNGVWTSTPAAVSWGVGRLDVVGLGTDRTVWHINNSDNWQALEYLGVTGTGSPAVSSRAPGQLSVGVEIETKTSIGNTIRELREISWPDSSWVTRSWQQVDVALSPGFGLSMVPQLERNYPSRRDTTVLGTERYVTSTLKGKTILAMIPTPRPM